LFERSGFFSSEFLESLCSCLHVDFVHLGCLFCSVTSISAKSSLSFSASNFSRLFLHSMWS
jgi:hypothetical protein